MRGFARAAGHRLACFVRRQMPSLIDRVSLLWRTFTPTEAVLLKAVIATLDPQDQILARRQLAAVNHVQRLLDWTEVSLFAARWGQVRWPSEALFPNRGEFELASLKFSIGRMPYRGSLWCVGGHMFSLVVRPSIKSVAFCQVQQLAVAVIGNPGASSPSRPQLAPLLPPSYLQYCASSVTEHQSSEWRVAKLEDVHLVHRASGDYLFLAQRDTEFLFANGSSPSSRIYHSVAGEEPEPVGESFAEALARP